MKKILLVEDDLAYLKLLDDLLTKNGYEVIQAKDGKKGLELAKRVQPDLILLDIEMPVMNGMAMLREYREDEYGKSANVIVITNFDPDDKILQSVLKDLPMYYLIKSDIQLNDLLEKIKNILFPAKKFE